MTVQNIRNKRSGTAADWTAISDRVLGDGEVGVETDTGKQKVGDGRTSWAALPYDPGTSGTSGTGTELLSVETITNLTVDASGTIGVSVDQLQLVGSQGTDLALVGDVSPTEGNAKVISLAGGNFMASAFVDMTATLDGGSTRPRYVRFGVTSAGNFGGIQNALPGMDVHLPCLNGVDVFVSEEASSIDVAPGNDVWTFLFLQPVNFFGTDSASVYIGFKAWNL